MKRTRLLHLVLPVILVAAFISGCKKDDSSNPTTPPAGTGYVMATHASPDAPTVDLYVDGTKVASNVSYLMSTSYLPVAEGTHTVDVKLAGTSTTVYTIPAPAAANVYYSVFAGGKLADFSFYGFIDTLTTPASGKAHVRFIHMSPDAPAVDVWVVGGTKLVSNASFAEATSFAPVDAGTYSFDVRLAGTSTSVLSVPNVAFAAGKIYTVYARGLVGGTGAQALGASVIVNK